MAKSKEFEPNLLALTGEKTVVVKGKDKDRKVVATRDLEVRFARTPQEILAYFKNDTAAYLKAVNGLIVNLQVAPVRTALKPVDVNALIHAQAEKMVTTFAKMGIVKSVAECATIIRSNMA